MKPSNSLFNCHPIKLILQSLSYRKSKGLSYDHTVEEHGSDANRENYSTNTNDYKYQYYEQE